MTCVEAGTGDDREALIEISGHVNFSIMDKNAKSVVYVGECLWLFGMLTYVECPVAWERRNTSRTSQLFLPYHHH